jgi:hypothetical protein
VASDGEICPFTSNLCPGFLYTRGLGDLSRAMLFRLGRRARMLYAILVLGASATKLEFGKDILVQTGQHICHPCRMDVISTSRDMTLQQDLKPDKRSAMCSH